MPAEIITSCSQTFLQIARRKADCKVLGPGIRAVIWFYGCSRQCPGCVASAMNTSGIFESETPESLYEWVKTCSGIEGITISGGEPFEQDKSALYHFLQLVRKDERKLGVICFSGFTIEQLCNAGNSDILDCMDLLIDGPYIENENDNMGLRGSANQRIHFLTDRYRSMENAFFSQEARNLEIELDLNENILINGIPDKNFLENFAGKMQDAGYFLSFK